MVHADLENPEYRAWAGFLAGTEGWSRDRIAEYQLAELQRVIGRAYTSTVGYKESFDAAGVGPADLRTLDDIRHFPLVSKPEMRDDPNRFAVPGGDLEYVTTGGSTGIPFGFFRDRPAFAKELASKAHQYHRIGWREGDRQLVFRGLPIDTPDHTVFEERFNELRCSSYHLTPEWMESFRRQAVRYEPDWIRCYPSSGSLYARWLEETGASFPEVKGVLCASENLYDHQRDLLSRAFNCRVFSHYGHYELAVLAGFCEREDTYHVLPFYGYAELLSRDGAPVTAPGATGEIVGTSFIMGATQFIRYRTGDIARLQGFGCASCGRPYQIWERIEGRLQEFLLTGTGRLISMTAINMHDDIFDEIKQFQFHQSEPGRATFRFIPGENCDEGAVAAMRSRLMVKLGADIELAMEAVDAIAPTHRGKFRFLIQELELPVFHD